MVMTRRYLILLFAMLPATLLMAQEKKDALKCIVPEMVFVKEGTFTMGNNKSSIDDEKPEHKVLLSSYYIGKYEVSVAEFRRFMDTHTYVTDAEKDGFSWVWDGKSLIHDMKGVTWQDDVFGKKRIGQENHPVIHVSRNDAEAYCKWLSELTGKKYRLPTEAEWEYAAKGGPKHEHFQYSGSNQMTKVGWFAFNSDGATHPVGMKAPNGLGIHDMSGNVWEWCSGWFGAYTAEQQTDPAGVDTGSDGILRGGAWRFFSSRTTCTARRNCIPSFNGSGIGFRLACSVK